MRLLKACNLIATIKKSTSNSTKIKQMSTELVIGASVALKSKGASTGRTGKIIEINGSIVRVHWTRKSSGGDLSVKSWVIGRDLMVIDANGGHVMPSKQMTPAQAAIQRRADYLKDKVNEPFTGADWPALIAGLQEVPPTTLWGTVITWALREGHDLSQLVEELASQAADDPFTMMSIVGTDTTILLLRYLPH